MVSAVKDFDQQQSAVSYGDPGCHAGQYLVADAILIFTGDLSAGQGEFGIFNGYIASCAGSDSRGF